MLEYSNTESVEAIHQQISSSFLHEKKSCESPSASLLLDAIAEHSELIDGLACLTGHGFSLDDFEFILQRLGSQIEAITSIASSLADVDTH
ncbi:hypothetical protein [Aeromonas veronii]|uniref:hypothetical protein n=1 Tax=Aeromonas veronii TaxID=654 RepID=UPI0013026F88|nr:hypothetical protein [Aeromonas veronii]KAE9627471.1 hypothetical protein GO977_22170 [Aeromonas veronii]